MDAGPRDRRSASAGSDGGRPAGKWSRLSQPTRKVEKSKTRLESQVSHGLQLQPLWVIPTAAVGLHEDDGRQGIKQPIR